MASAKAGLRTRVVAFFGKIDMVISELSDAEARVFLDEYGISAIMMLEAEGRLSLDDGLAKTSRTPRWTRAASRCVSF